MVIVETYYICISFLLKCLKIIKEIIYFYCRRFKIVISHFHLSSKGLIWCIQEPITLLKRPWSQILIFHWCPRSPPFVSFRYYNSSSMTENKNNMDCRLFYHNTYRSFRHLLFIIDGKWESQSNFRRDLVVPVLAHHLIIRGIRVCREHREERWIIASVSWCV